MRPSPADASTSTHAAVTGWGQLRPRFGTRATPASAAAEIADARAFARMKPGGEWRRVQNQSTGSVGGAHFATDCAGNSSVPAGVVALPGGSTRFNSTRLGRSTKVRVDPRGTSDPTA